MPVRTSCEKRASRPLVPGSNCVRPVGLPPSRTGTAHCSPSLIKRSENNLPAFRHPASATAVRFVPVSEPLLPIRC